MARKNENNENNRGVRYDVWTPWPVYWSAVWVGVLSALALALIFGLAGLALGAQVLGPWPAEPESWSGMGWGALLVAVFGAFLAFVAGGWVAGQIAGIYRAETAMLHGAIVWLMAVPLLLLFASVGAGGFFGGWYGGLAGTPTWVETNHPQLAPNATEEQKAQVQADQERAARIARNSALGAITALLLGLMGSVLGGWIASGEPMNFSAFRKRNEQEAELETAGGRRSKT
jgi:hypothetical protein